MYKVNVSSFAIIITDPCNNFNLGNMKCCNVIITLAECTYLCFKLYFKYFFFFITINVKPTYLNAVLVIKNLVYLRQLFKIVIHIIIFIFLNKMNINFKKSFHKFFLGRTITLESTNSAITASKLSK